MTTVSYNPRGSSNVDPDGIGPTPFIAIRYDDSCGAQLRRTFAQEASILAGLLLLLATTTINFVYILHNFVDEDFVNDINDVDGFLDNWQYLFVPTFSCWYIGAVVGSVLCGLKRTSWSPRHVNYMAIIMLCIVSALLILWDHSVRYFLDIARVLAGLCHGIVYISLLTQIADNITRSNRAFIVSSIPLITTIGLVGIAAVGIRTPISFHLTLLTGILTTVCCCTSAILTWLFTGDSITRLIECGKEIDARNVVLKLHNNGSVETWTTRKEFDEKKVMVHEEFGTAAVAKGGWLHIFADGNTWPIVLITSLKLLYGLIAALIVFFTITILNSPYNIDFYFETMSVMLALRAFATLAPKMFMDNLGRRWFLLASGVGSSLLLISLAVIVNTKITLGNEIVALIVLQFTHIIFAVGIEPAQHIFAAEAFSLTKRNASLAFATCIDYLVQGLLLLWLLAFYKNVYILSTILYIAPAVIISLTIFLFVKLPETKAMPLRQCRDEFNKRRGAIISYISSTERRPTGLMPY